MPDPSKPPVQQHHHLASSPPDNYSNDPHSISNMDSPGMPAKKAKMTPKSPSDILKTGTVTIRQLKQIRATHTESGTLMAVVAAISPTLPKHELLFSIRTRIALVDPTGLMVAYIHPQPFLGEVGDVVSFKDFSVKDGRMTIYQNTTVGR